MSDGTSEAASGLRENFLKRSRSKQQIFADPLFLRGAMVKALDYESKGPRFDPSQWQTIFHHDYSQLII